MELCNHTDFYKARQICQIFIPPAKGYFREKSKLQKRNPISPTPIGSTDFHP